jgi:phospholipid/cholesterol/gamma-HCH transport system substrate-binding protein
MKIMTTETKIGLFTIGSFLALAYMFFVLNPSRFSSEKYKSYYTLVRDASGIIENSNVQTNGVTIGRVTSIQLVEDGWTRIDFEIKSFVKVPRGSKTVVKEKGLLGDVYLGLMRSNNYNDLLVENDFLEAFEGRMGIGDLTSMAGNIGKDVQKITHSLANTISTEEGEKALHDILLDLRDSLALIKNTLQNNSQNVDQITENVRNVSENLVSVSETVKTLFDFKNDEKSMKNVFESMKEISKNMELASASIKNIAQGLDNGQGTLGKLIKDDKLIVDIEEGISSVNEMLSPARRLHIDVDYHGEYRFDSENQHFVNLKLQTRPDLFYLLGVTNTYSTESYSQLTIDGETSNLNKDLQKPHKEALLVTRKQDAIRFNLQVGKRWHDLELRLGLFESTGGVGLDYYFLKDAIKVGFEAYDWNMSYSNNFKKRNYALFRTYVNVNLFSHLYLIGGLNDFTKKGTWEDGKYPFFLGAGFNFTDKDLTSILGASSFAR